jgi:hypothetical protein
MSALEIFGYAALFLAGLAIVFIEAKILQVLIFSAFTSLGSKAATRPWLRRLWTVPAILIATGTLMAKAAGLDWHIALALLSAPVILTAGVLIVLRQINMKRRDGTANQGQNQAPPQAPDNSGPQA